MYIQTRKEFGQAPASSSTPQASGDSLLRQMQSALTAGQWQLALSLAIRSGNRDANKLINLIFFARHPERGGRKLHPTEPQFQQLRSEWLNIGRRLVGPFLQKLRPSSSTGSSATSASPTLPATGASAVPSAPRLIGYKDNTLYVEISLGINQAPNAWKKYFKVKPCTGIFVPTGYSPQSTVNLIVYLHGHTSAYPGDGVSIDGYWNSPKFPFFAFREGVAASTKNVILVAPTLGPRSQAGSLTSAGGCDAFLTQVMAALVAHGPYKKAASPPNRANIILACHSGGGSAMLRIAMKNDSRVGNIQECWGFDCLYSGYADKAKTKKLFTQPENWLAWGKSHRNKKLFIYFCDATDCQSTKRESEYLANNAAKPPNVIVERSMAKNHFWVPLAHWKKRIQNALFLPDR
jgi:hypothetical protein